ncbi:hypothetical protein ADEAN_000166700 [Angomonas deanei]|uniref:Uncharacterized protein n=1 Tax=Angomonas deanei TaxID=59799 RepID=A0A7G2C625_9TRYP|nr:hypothetical protein ADEAN_000166700 [Angomonas deanei]
MSDADEYLKRVADMKKQRFSKGYISTPPPPTKPSLPMKKKRNRGDSPSEVRAPVAPKVAEAVPAKSPNAVSLFDKYFPGNTLKEATVEVCHAPPEDFVEKTVARFVQWRERIIALRSGVEDIGRFLRNAGYEEAKGFDRAYIDSLITNENWTEAKEELEQFCSHPPNTRKGTAQCIRHILRRKSAQQAPPMFSIVRWHHFIDHYGPEANRYPSVSTLVWISSSSTTAFFTVFTQRLLRSVTQALVVAKSGAVQSAYTEQDFSNTASDEEKEEGSNGKGWLVAQQPLLEDSISDACKGLLVFLRLLMPSVSVEGDRKSSGLGVWLSAALTGLDFPLDPDTDRLAHELFRSACDHVRVLGEWKKVQGNTRGALLLAFPEVGPENKTYTSMDCISREDVLALYTLIVVLAKCFRQNVNHLIPL